VDRRAKVELFEQIRREYEHGGGTIRGIAKKLGIVLIAVGLAVFFLGFPSEAQRNGYRE